MDDHPPRSPTGRSQALTVPPSPAPAVAAALTEAGRGALAEAAALARNASAPAAVILVIRTRKTAVPQIIIDAEAGTLSAELTRRGVAADARVHVVVDILDTGTLRWQRPPRPARPSNGSMSSRNSTRTPISSSTPAECLSSVALPVPFTDLSGDKRRPALVVSHDNDRRSHLVVCFITSVRAAVLTWCRWPRRSCPTM